MEAITAIIHLHYNSYNVDIYVNKNSGFILPAGSEVKSKLDQEVYEVTWNPTTDMNTYLIIQAFDPRYRKVIPCGDVIGSIGLEQEESSVVVYKDHKTPTGLALDIELYYPNDIRVKKSIWHTREAGVEVMEILGSGKDRTVQINKPKPPIRVVFKMC